MPNKIYSISTYSGFILCLFRYKSGSKPFTPISTVTQLSWRNSSGKLSVPLLIPGVFSRTQTVEDRKVFFRDRMTLHAIACDRSNIACNRMQSLRHCMRLHVISATLHAIACDLRSHGSQELSHVQQGGLNLTNKTQVCFHFHHHWLSASLSNESSYRPSHCFPSYRRTSVATSRRNINCIVIPSVVVSSHCTIILSSVSS